MKWENAPTIDQATWDEREARISELEKQIADIHASTRRMSFREEWYFGGLRNAPGDYVIMRIGPVTSGDVPFQLKEDETEMHALRQKDVKAVPVKFLRARCGVRYWEDGTVNGEEDGDGSRIPCREGTAADNDHLGGGNWRPTIDLDTGKIEGWPEGTTASIHYKVCDDGDYELLDADRNVVKAIEGYVPGLMCPEGDGYGDYVIMEIGPDGTIAKWRADLSEFEQDE